MDRFTRFMNILNDFCEALANSSHSENVSFAPTLSPLLETTHLMEQANLTNSTRPNVSSFNEAVIISSLLSNSEKYAIPCIASTGMLVNILLVVVLSRDSDLHRSTYSLLKTALAVEICYLASVLVFVLFRRTELRHSLDVMSYVTCAMSIALFAMNWTFLAMICDASRVLHQTCYTDKPHTRRIGRCTIALIITSALVFHLPYIPYIRIQIFSLHHIFDPCGIPIEYQWDLHPAKHWPTDWYYLVYFAMVYFVVVFALPFFFVGCVDKDILDLLYLLTGRRDLPVGLIHAANTAMAVAVLSNVYLVCMSLKAIIFGFRIVNHFCLFFRGHVQMFFYFMNTSGNILLLLRPTLNLLVFVLYNRRMRWVIHQMACGRRRYRHLVAGRVKSRRPDAARPATGITPIADHSDSRK